MARLEDVHYINQLMYTFVDAHDNLDKDLMMSLCAPTGMITLDVSSHLSRPAMELSPSDFADIGLRSVAGFTATHHILAHPTVKFDDQDSDKARARMIGVAYHCIQEQDGDQESLESVTGMAYQTMDVERHDGEWKFRRLIVERTYPLDNPTLYQKARERLEKGLGRTIKTNQTSSW